MAHAVRTPRPGMSFVTIVTHGQRPIFEITRLADLFVDTLLHYREQGHYKVHAYVVMPDHVHLLLTPQGITLEQTVRLIKTGFNHRIDIKSPVWEDGLTGFTYQLDPSLPIWEEGFTGYSVANIRDLEVVRAYVHQLPVRAHLTPAAEMYPHSSAYRQIPHAAPAESHVTH